MLPEQNFVDPMITSTWTNGDKGICPSPEIVEIPPHYGPAPEPVPIPAHYGPAPEPVPIPPYCGTPKKKEPAQITDDMVRDEYYKEFVRTTEAEKAAKNCVKKYRITIDNMLRLMKDYDQEGIDHLMEGFFLRGVEWANKQRKRYEQ